MTTNRPHPLPPVLASALLTVVIAAALTRPVAAQTGPVLDERLAEHMFNRFGFGARPGELRAAAGMRPGELFDQWIENSKAPKTPKPKYFGYWEYGYDANGHELVGAPILALPRAELIKRQEAMRLEDRVQFSQYRDSLFADMVEGRDPLRERLALFWHGFFPTSSRVVLRRYELILQHHFLRTGALGNFGDLLRGMVRDPAMLGYFDNDTNSKTHPNENFARELMELYSLGVGNYTEVDVREAARTLTGYQGETGIFVFDEQLHDAGEKTILGQTGNFTGDDLVEILLQQEACSTYVARRLLTWLEGLQPSPGRLKSYAGRLRELDYELTPWLRTLATDPEFFREEVVGTRVQSPIEFFASTSHRLNIRQRSAFLFYAATAAGQQFYSPPTVKGWDEGSAWITSSTLTIRGNCVGLLLGHLQKAMVKITSPADKQRFRAFTKGLRANGMGQPKLIQMARRSLGQQADDPQIVRWVADSFLARAPTAATLGTLRDELAWCRMHFEVSGDLLQSPSANQVLCHLAYVLLRLPIAQLG